ncbi:Bax inhibitor-1 family protein [Magnetospirillum fulvum]|uniref:Integral membrane protein, interacts with FtsH n=1 Tax=Magnetospirillum fulvum MGU-K5 TaxID=1316936 RepID=S9S960_MAGFU|nr:Bax inhibitor-1/YccA family protein [Magnetospirillum fulvum]EPY02437.1 integral membrane protein, interacts with FtsH [Magnetospirillum fulvum MGU-K5]
MSFGTDRRYMTPAQAQAAQIDVGLRQYMLRVYNYMASGLALTGIVALLVASTPVLTQAIFGTPLKWVVMLAPIGFVFFLSARIEHIRGATASALFWVFAALMGASLSSVFLIYTGASVARTFFITAAAFGALSLYGYTTKRDLSGFASFLFMGVIGLLIAGIVNIFLQSSMMQFVISAAGVLIFAGLTAFDTQRIKEMYWEGANYGDTATKTAVMGALSLYMDFINMFTFLLQFLGDRRE